MMKLRKNKPISTLALVLLLALTFVLAGCGASNSEQSADTPDSSGNVADTLKIGVVSFADTLEPTEQYFSWVVMRYGVGETLVKFDEHMVPQPWLAESWSLAEDKLTWTFQIRDGIQFSNGTALTAELVKASLERTFDMSKRASSDFFQYESIQTEASKLMIKTKTPVPGLPGCLADPLFLIVDTTADTTKFAVEGPICTGPYAVQSFDKEKCVVVRNEHYWDGAVPYAEVVFRVIDDTNVRAMALQSGEIDIAVNIGSSDLPLFLDNEKFNVHTISSLRTVLSFMNQHGPLGDMRVRQAVIRGLDRNTYADKLLHGTFTAGKAPIPPSLDYGFDTLSDPNAYDAESAKNLLAEAGYTDTDGDGYVDKDGQKLSLRYIIYDSRAELPILAEATQANLKDIGVNVSIETYDYTTLLDMQETGEYDLLIWNVITANTGDPENYLKEYWKTHTEENKNANTAGYSNAEVDRLLGDLSVEFDPDRRRELIIAVQQLIINDAASIFYAYPETNIISGKNVTGVQMLPADYYWLTHAVKPAN